MARRVYQVYGGFGSGYFKDTKRVTNVVMKDEITPMLESLSKYSMNDAVEATRSVAYQLRLDIRSGISAGSIDGINIPRRKILDAKGMNRLVTRFKTSKIKGGHQIRKYMLRLTRRFKGDATGGRSLFQAVVYQKIPKVGSVVGWGSKTSPRWGAVVQRGSWGEPGMENKTGPQPVARGSKQWKFLAAIGMLPKGGRSMKRNPAAFFAQFINRRQSSGWITRQMNAYFAKKIRERELLSARKSA